MLEEFPKKLEMLVLISGTELEMQATGAALIELANTLVNLKSGQISFFELVKPLSPETIYPYSAALVGLRTQLGDGLVSITVNENVLEICGDKEFLEILAHNFLYCARTMQEAFDTKNERPGQHFHIEYYPEHFYLQEHSYALVVLVVKDKLDLTTPNAQHKTTSTNQILPENTPETKRVRNSAEPISPAYVAMAAIMGHLTFISWEELRKNLEESPEGLELLRQSLKQSPQSEQMSKDAWKNRNLPLPWEGLL